MTKASFFDVLFAFTKPLSKDGKIFSKSASNVAIVWTLKKFQSWVELSKPSKKREKIPKGGGGAQSQSLNYWYNFDKARNFDLKTRWTEWVCWCEAIQLLIFSIKRQENVVKIKTITKYSKQIKGQFGRKEKK